MGGKCGQTQATIHSAGGWVMMRRVNGIYVRQTNKTNNCSFIFINLKNTFAAQYIFCAYAVVYATRRRRHRLLVLEIKLASVDHLPMASKTWISAH